MAENSKVSEEDKAKPEREASEPMYISGMGFGATSKAIRWARTGYLIEQLVLASATGRPSKRGRGSPKLDPIQGKDSMRAFYAWHMLRHLRKVTGKPNLILRNREIIHLCRLAEAASSVPTNERIFPQRGNYEASLSRGKSNLQIDVGWCSELCEKIGGI